MIRRRLWTSLIAIVTVAVVLLAGNLLASNEPVLGLDLRGGISVVLAPDVDASSDDLTIIRDLIRDELEGRGIAEPDVRVEGENIIVDLPGVRDQRDALNAVNVAGIVTLRPVVSQCTPVIPETVVDGTTVADGTATDDTATDDTATDTATGSTAAGFRRSAPDDSAPDSVTETTIAETTTTTTEPLGPMGTNPLTTMPQSPYAPPPPSSDDTTIELQTRDGLVCTVGPAQRGPTGEVSGFAFSKGSAKAELDPNGGWFVSVGLQSSGASSFNQVIGACFQGDQNICPTRQLAIVMDGEIISAPVVNDAAYSDSLSITGRFSESEARDLARVLDRGAFPVQVHAETVQTISATLGEDSMRASVFAALIGIALVLAMLAYFYRRLVLVVVAGITVWAMLIYSAAAFVSQTTNFALTLAGITGIIVAIGVTVDSYVVYFERMKEEVRHGRTIRNASLRSFTSTWRTILMADLVAFLAAIVLFLLSVGSVRGFALYLGLTTVIDVIVFYFFTRPAVGLVADTGWLDEGDTFGLKDYE